MFFVFLTLLPSYLLILLSSHPLTFWFLMKAVIQRVKSASVEVDGKIVGQIGRGLLVLLGIGQGDTEEDIRWMVEKIINLRIFEKEDGKFDESLLDIRGELLVVSQFTLYGDASKGRRPSFSDAMGSKEARELFEVFVEKAREKIEKVETGIFQASMDVHLVNEGPVTL
ncbi:MAG: D-aminoacyl-tRNA deacylase, partial [Syntrophorhabdaceae bacterium]|nr:D-aminoacyl-tRNA deacylase [Syntrophorhabdaceae bacterium]